MISAKGRRELTLRQWGSVSKDEGKDQDHWSPDHHQIDHPALQGSLTSGDTFLIFARNTMRKRISDLWVYQANQPHMPFFTISPCKRHDPPAIWAHLELIWIISSVPGKGPHWCPKNTFLVTDLPPNIKTIQIFTSYPLSHIRGVSRQWHETSLRQAMERVHQMEWGMHWREQLTH